MRGLTWSSFGPAGEVLKLRDLPIPDAGPGEVLVRIRFSGVNPSDTRATAGGRPGVTQPPFPLIVPHSDGSGEIAAVGQGVDPARVGQRVWLWNAQWRRAFGTAAEFVALPSEQAVPLPEGISLEAGAVLGIPGLTATHAVLADGPVAGKVVLVSGGAGSVGHLAVQAAQAAGAEVIATAHGTLGIDAARAAGAHHVLDYRDPDLAGAILRASGGRLVDRAVEVEFGRNIDTLAQVMAEGGTIAAYGSAQEMTPRLPFYPLMFKAVRIDCVLVYLLSPEARTRATASLTAMLEHGEVAPRIAHVLPLERGAEAHELVEAGKRRGAVLLEL